MKKAIIMLLSLFAMMASGTGLSAQEVTVVLQPGWNWIGYPYSESADLETAFGDFEPMPGDVIASFGGLSDYIEGLGWLGEVDEMKPGWGYMYYSSRTAVVSVVLHAPTTSSIVTTAEPTDITGTSAVAGGTVTLGEGNHVFARGVCWSTEHNPDIDGSHTSDGVEIGSFSVTLEGLTLGTTYYVRAYVVTDYGLAYGEEQSFTTESHDYVDLSLPSGTLWATCNVGASTPEGYGDYFAWGETQPKNIYNWNTYQYCNGNETSLTKYCNNYLFGYNGFTDELTILEPMDDAATINWGNGWRMPTYDEWVELYQNTSYVWTTQNGVIGQLFTASNGNNLFLPATGYRGGNNLILDDWCYYWTSSLSTDNPDGGPHGAWYYYFFMDEIYLDTYGMFEGSRDCGMTVRPVRTQMQETSFIINVIANPVEGGRLTGRGLYQEGAECEIMATANPGYYFTNWTENGEVVSTDAVYSFTVNSSRVLVANFEHSYVDLDLPSGTMWAACNLGAISPESYGDYFAWGETQQKDYYYWNTYQYCSYAGDNQYLLTKYCNNPNYGYNYFTDDLITLLPEDDVANANWGVDWRIPTHEEWQELYENTTRTWTTQNGVNGMLFTASNGNSIFLPAAGYHRVGELSFAGRNGIYWSSSLNTEFPNNAWSMEFASSFFYLVESYRYEGLSIRPVCSYCSVSQNNAPTGAINGKFTINDNGDQVYFSQGNLQYQASTNTWRFAENQWDYVGTQNPPNGNSSGGTVSGSDNYLISSTYNGWIDLFGWGTSGFNHGANCYQPWSTSETSSDYYVYGSYTYNLYDQTGQADWGYNPISNGGNVSNYWRTLTQSEWIYIINTRITTSGIRYAKAQVNNVNGIILLSDDWDNSTYNLSNTNNGGASYNSNVINTSQWTTLEDAGAVFLPAAGGRSGSFEYGVGFDGDYWSASCKNYLGAGCVGFNDESIGTGGWYSLYGGISVRLARSAQ